MKTEQQRIAIAEACGYVFKDEAGRFPEDQDWQKYKAVYSKDGGFIGLAKPEWIPVPNYTACLNDIHEAEKVLTRDQINDYEGELVSLRGENFAYATAAQRAEAFLRTIGKWEESA